MSNGTRHEWQQTPSVLTGGKPYFYTRLLTEYHGYRRVTWNRDVRAYAATVDYKYGDRPLLVGYYTTVADGMRAVDAVTINPLTGPVRPVAARS